MCSGSADAIGRNMTEYYPHQIAILQEDRAQAYLIHVHLWTYGKTLRGAACQQLSKRIAVILVLRIRHAIISGNVAKSDPQTGIPIRRDLHQSMFRLPTMGGVHKQVIAASYLS